MIGQTLHVPLYYEGKHIGDEHIIIDSVPVQTAKIIRDSFEYSYQGNLPERLPILAIRTKNFSRMLAAQLPFLGFETADAYDAYVSENPKLCGELWDKHNDLFTRPFNLSELLTSKNVDCHSMSLAVSLTLEEFTPSVYHRQEILSDGRIKKKRHMVSAFAHKNNMIIVDPTEGPFEDSVAIEDFYVNNMTTFLQKYCGPIILPTPSPHTNPDQTRIKF